MRDWRDGIEAGRMGPSFEEKNRRRDGSELLVWLNRRMRLFEPKVKEAKRMDWGCQLRRVDERRVKMSINGLYWMACLLLSPSLGKSLKSSLSTCCLQCESTTSSSRALSHGCRRYWKGVVVKGQKKKVTNWRILVPCPHTLHEHQSSLKMNLEIEKPTQEKIEIEKPEGVRRRGEGSSKVSR